MNTAQIELHAIAMRLQHVTGASETLVESWMNRWKEKHRFWHSIDHLFELKRLLGDAWRSDDVFLLAFSTISSMTRRARKMN